MQLQPLSADFNCMFINHNLNMCVGMKVWKFFGIRERAGEMNFSIFPPKNTIPLQSD